jgi:DNA-binding transcriptional regulator WhiA
MYHKDPLEFQTAVILSNEEKALSMYGAAIKLSKEAKNVRERKGAFTYIRKNLWVF